MSSISYKNLIKQFDIWSKKYSFFAPVKKDDDFVYEQIIDFKNFIIVNNLTIIPLKKFLIPSKEVLFKFDNNKITKPNSKITKSIILVTNPTELNAIKILDQIYTNDTHYQSRRKNLIFLAIGVIKPNLYDVFLEKIDDEYIIDNKSNNLIFNKNLISKSQKISAVPIKPFIDPIFADQKKLSNAIKLSANDPIWDQLASICLGCGICSYVCPLCYCSFNKDELNLSASLCDNCNKVTTGTRSRKWDSCLLSSFSVISQNHNFRPKLRDGIYNWYHHKFVRFSLEFGKVGCINCGRCIKYCPAKINYKKVLNEIITKYS